MAAAEGLKEVYHLFGSLLTSYHCDVQIPNNKLILQVQCERRGLYSRYRWTQTSDL